MKIPGSDTQTVFGHVTTVLGFILEGGGAMGVRKMCMSTMSLISGLI